MSRRSFIGGALAAPVVATAVNGRAVAQTTTIRMATSWSGGVHLETFARGFAREAEQLTQGRVRIQVFPAGTIGSPLKVTETVQKKIAQAGHHWCGYDWGLDKTSVLFGGYAGSPGAEAFLHWMYEGGAAKLWAEWRLEKFNVVAMPCGVHSDEIHMHSRKPVRTVADLQGLKFRTSGAAAEIAASLGASTVILAGGEVYQALERGVVDAIEWATPSINYPFGFQRISKFAMLPGVHQPVGFQEVIFAKDVWEGFDARTKTMLEIAARKTTLDSWLQVNYQDTEALEKFRADGVEFVRLDDSYIEAWNKATREWTDKQVESGGPWFKRVLDHQRAFQARWNAAKSYRTELR